MARYVANQADILGHNSAIESVSKLTPEDFISLCMYIEMDLINTFLPSRCE